MEAGKLNQYIEIYKVIKGQSASGDSTTTNELITPVLCTLMRSTYKDYKNKDFSTTSNLVEKNLVLPYRLKNLITPKNRVLYNSEWYEVVDVEPDEQYMEDLKVRLRLIK